MHKPISISFNSSKNYAEEHVSDFIWSGEPGTVITVTVEKDESCTVKVVFKDEQVTPPIE